MKPEDKNLDKALSEDDLDTVSGGVFAANVSSDPGARSALSSSISVCSVQNGNNGSDALAPNNK